MTARLTDSTDGRGSRDESSSDGRDTTASADEKRIGRREAMKKAAVGAGVLGAAWAAPRIEGLSVVPDTAMAATCIDTMATSPAYGALMCGTGFCLQTMGAGGGCSSNLITGSCSTGTVAAFMVGDATVTPNVTTNDGSTGANAVTVNFMLGLFMSCTISNVMITCPPACGTTNLSVSGTMFTWNCDGGYVSGCEVSPANYGFQFDVNCVC